MAASSVSPYISTEETTNANRACRLLLGPCTDQLRDVLRKEVPPPTFAFEINKQKLNLPRLNPEQRNMILPIIGSYSGNYNDFDISLLYILLRNICKIAPHKNGWGYDPDVNDRCLSANIERIRLSRNNTVHCSRPFLTNSSFINFWTLLRGAVVDIDTYLSNGYLYEREVDVLRWTTMDPVQDKYYREQLAKQYADDQDTKQIIRTLNDDLGSYQRETLNKFYQIEEKLKILMTIEGKEERGRRILIVGDSGSGRSSFGYNLLGGITAFKDSFSVHPNTCCGTGEWNGQEVTLCIPMIDDLIIRNHLEFWRDMQSRYVWSLSPGFHVIAFVIACARLSRDTLHILENLKTVLGDDFNKYVLIVFTKIDYIAGNRTFESCIERSHERLKKAIQDCGYIGICNYAQESELKDQINNFYKKVNEKICKNSKKYYSNKLSEHVYAYLKREAESQGMDKSQVRKMEPPLSIRKLIQQNVSAWKMPYEKCSLS